MTTKLQALVRKVYGGNQPVRMADPLQAPSRIPIVGAPYDTPEQHAFINAIAHAPEDDAPRLVYADWLDEHGMSDEAARMRWTVQAKHEFHPDNLLNANPSERRYVSPHSFEPNDRISQAIYNIYKKYGPHAGTLAGVLHKKAMYAYAPPNWGLINKSFDSAAGLKGIIEGLHNTNELAAVGAVGPHAFEAAKRMGVGNRTSLSGLTAGSTVPELGLVHGIRGEFNSGISSAEAGQDIPHPKQNGEPWPHVDPVLDSNRATRYNLHGHGMSPTEIDTNVPHMTMNLLEHPHWESFPQPGKLSMQSVRTRLKRALLMGMMRAALNGRPLKLTTMGEEGPTTPASPPEPHGVQPAHTHVEAGSLPHAEAAAEGEEEPEEVDPDQQPYHCPTCGNDHDTREEGMQVWENGTHACTDCTGYCPECEGNVDPDEMTEVNGVSDAVRRQQRNLSYPQRRQQTTSMCENCLDTNATRCADCGDWYHNDHLDNSGGSNSNDERVCQGCAENYFYCDSCNNTFHNDDYGSEGNCQNCDTQTSNQVHDAHYTPRPWVQHGGPARKFGVELETATKRGGDLDDTATETLDTLNRDLPNENFAFLKEDSSINGPAGGFEIVTHPATLPFHRERWAPFFEDPPRYLDSDYEKYDTGLHIHVSRKNLTDFHILKMVTFVNAAGNREFVHAMAGRRESNWSKYKQKTAGEVRRNEGSKYESLNLLHPNSIEFRIFSGTMNKDRFFRALEFTDAVTEFAKSAYSGLQQLQSPDLFFNFVQEHRKDYPVLSRYVANFAKEREQAAREPSMQSAQLQRQDIPVHLTRFGANQQMPLPRLTPRPEMSVVMSYRPKKKPTLSPKLKAIVAKIMKMPPRPAQFSRDNATGEPSILGGETEKTAHTVKTLFGHDPDGVPAWKAVQSVIAPHTPPEQVAPITSLVVANWLNTKKTTDPFTLMKVVHAAGGVHPRLHDAVVNVLRVRGHEGGEKTAPGRPDFDVSYGTKHIGTPLDVHLGRSQFLPSLDNIGDHYDTLQQVKAHLSNPGELGQLEKSTLGNKTVKSELIRAMKLRPNTSVGVKSPAAILQDTQDAITGSPQRLIAYRAALDNAARTLHWTTDQVHESAMTGLVGLLAAKLGVSDKEIRQHLHNDASSRGEQPHESTYFPNLAYSADRGRTDAAAFRRVAATAKNRAQDASRPGFLRDSGWSGLGSSTPGISGGSGRQAGDMIKRALIKHFQAMGLFDPRTGKLKNARLGESLRLAQYDAPLDFGPAQDRVTASNQQVFTEHMKQILMQAGIVPHLVTPVIHDVAGAARASVMATGKFANPNAPQLGAAWTGLLGRQPGMLAFMSHPQGPDSVYHFKYPNVDVAKKALNQAGVVSSVIVPNKTDYSLYIYDKGGMLRQGVASALTQLGVVADEWKGQGQTVGGKQDDMGREQYRDTINKVEGSGQQPQAAPAPPPAAPTQFSRALQHAVRVIRERTNAVHA